MVTMALCRWDSQHNPGTTGSLKVEGLLELGAGWPSRGIVVASVNGVGMVSLCSVRMIAAVDREVTKKAQANPSR